MVKRKATAKKASVTTDRPTIPRTTFTFKLYEDMAVGVEYVFNTVAKEHNMSDRAQIFEMIVMDWATQNIQGYMPVRNSVCRDKVEDSFRKILNDALTKPGDSKGLLSLNYCGVTLTVELRDVKPILMGIGKPIVMVLHRDPVSGAANDLSYIWKLMTEMADTRGFHIVMQPMKTPSTS